MLFTSKDYLPQCKVKVLQFSSGALLLCLVLFGIIWYCLVSLSSKIRERSCQHGLYQDGGVAALPTAIKDQLQIVCRPGWMEPSGWSEDL